MSEVLLYVMSTWVMPNPNTTDGRRLQSCMRKHLRLVRKRKDYAEVCRNYHSIVGMQRYFDSDAAYRSLDSVRNYIPLGIQEEETLWATHYYSLAKLESKIGKYNEAIEHIYQAIDSAKVHDRNDMVLNYEKALPAVLNALGRHQESAELCERLIPVLEESGKGHQYKHTVGYYSVALQKLGRYKEALDQRIYFQNLGDSLADIVKLKSIDESEARFKVVEKDKEIAFAKAGKRSSRRNAIR